MLQLSAHPLKELLVSSYRGHLLFAPPVELLSLLLDPLLPQAAIFAAAISARFCRSSALQDLRVMQLLQNACTTFATTSSGEKKIFTCATGNSPMRVLSTSTCTCASTGSERTGGCGFSVTTEALLSTTTRSSTTAVRSMGRRNTGELEGRGGGGFGRKRASIPLGVMCAACNACRRVEDAVDVTRRLRRVQAAARAARGAWTAAALGHRPAGVEGSQGSNFRGWGVHRHRKLAWFEQAPRVLRSSRGADVGDGIHASTARGDFVTLGLANTFGLLHLFSASVLLLGVRMEV
eukprot:CAMPEP_0205893210 /NCGR_PEP_ID=MMETSP1083-20121108/23117_1 /ASSEMBLY_ACC=CAM_ASM_000430 /TAXON_ID=97485 /ORGANISM="Prymnesium parvum, Strain Texoma1" /LENGTH=291 /DNA_ID=CAMNT_0053257837 /DNA_START=471 /DNA_END=1349 /DNA_ORIENTATION=-